MIWRRLSVPGAVLLEVYGFLGQLGTVDFAVGKLHGHGAIAEAVAKTLGSPYLFSMVLGAFLLVLIKLQDDKRVTERRMVLRQECNSMADKMTAFAGTRTQLPTLPAVTMVQGSPAWEAHQAQQRRLIDGFLEDTGRSFQSNYGQAIETMLRELDGLKISDDSLTALVPNEVRRRRSEDIEIIAGKLRGLAARL